VGAVRDFGQPPTARQVWSVANRHISQQQAVRAYRRKYGQTDKVPLAERCEKGKEMLVEQALADLVKRGLLVQRGEVYLIPGDSRQGRAERPPGRSPRGD
jgi:hypothetical protein